MRILSLLIALRLIAHCCADDWPQWRGPQRDGISAETGWLAGWPENGPPRDRLAAAGGQGALRRVGPGRRGLHDGLGWQAGHRLLPRRGHGCGAVEAVVSVRRHRAMERAAQHTDGATANRFSPSASTASFAPGMPRPARRVGPSIFPRATSPTPTMALPGRRSSRASCSSSARAARDWRCERRTARSRGAMMARPGACVSPMPFTLDGVRGVAVVAMDPSRDSVSVVGVEARHGAGIVALRDRGGKSGARPAATWCIHEGRVFLSTAEQHKLCAQFQFAPGPVREVWSNRKLSTYTGNVVLLAGHLYGVDKTGILKCLDWQNGEERWAQRGFDEYGTLIAADGKLIVQSGKSGTLAVVEATSAGYRELRKMKVFDGVCASFHGSGARGRPAVLPQLRRGHRLPHVFSEALMKSGAWQSLSAVSGTPCGC